MDKFFHVLDKEQTDEKPIRIIREVEIQKYDTDSNFNCFCFDYFYLQLYR